MNVGFMTGSSLFPRIYELRISSRLSIIPHKKSKSGLLQEAGFFLPNSQGPKTWLCRWAHFRDWFHIMTLQTLS